MRLNEVCHSAALGGCCRWRGRRCATNRGWPRRMRWCLAPCMSSRDSTRARATDGSRCLSRAEALCEMSAERTYRLWREAGLPVPRRRARRRIASGRPRPTPPTEANHVWACDFVYDRCANPQQLKCLTIADECRRASVWRSRSRAACAPDRSSKCSPSSSASMERLATCARTTDRSSSPGRY